jgi:adenosylhomocysteine nucleosidase
MSRIAIVSAMHEELRALLPRVEGVRVERRAGRACHLGRMCGREVLLVLSGIGKVSAATTTAVLLDGMDVRALLFTGVAGGLAPGVRVGDVVIGRTLLQHDMDASPLFPRYEIPLTGRSRFDADAVMSDALAAGCDLVLGAPHAVLGRFGITEPPRRHDGLVISGDRFVATTAESQALRQALPEALAVEMEGAAVAQVCADFGRPFALLRTVSDRADDAAHVDFGRFIAEVAAEYSRDIVQAALPSL